MPAPAHLILFTRYPRPGTCKTRLIPALGAQGAAALQRRMTERMAAEARRLQVEGIAHLTVHHDGGSAEEMTAWLGACEVRPQEGGDLGARMAAALRQAFASGAPLALLFGSDIPGLDSAGLRQALAALRECPVVLGPSSDGGYYLIGLSVACAEMVLPLLFTDMAWSTATVLATSEERLGRKGLAYTLLPQLADIDTPADLHLARLAGLL